MATLPILFVTITLRHVFAEHPVVDTKIGSIRGVLSSDGDINMFMGIPYATVNESNPFGRAIPHPGFETIFTASDDSAICPQIEEFNHTFVGDLDCLQLNIYTPASITANSRLPILFWIYGGGWQIGFFGRFMYGPKYLVRHDIILVTINYRVGPYGFMCLNTPEVPGNQGLHDTLLGLRWVNEHIEEFGGDPNQITLAGNSAGAMATDFHLMHEVNGKPMFQRAILQSGSVDMLSVSGTVTESAILIARDLGYETDDVNAAIAFLATVPPIDVIHSPSSSTANAPCVEQEFEGVEAFYAKNWKTAMHQVQNVSIMIGINDDEAYGSILPEFNNPNIVDLLLSLSYDTEHENFTGTEDVRKFYYGDKYLEEDTLRPTMDFFADYLFVHSSHRTLQKLLRDNAKTIYSYLFSHDGERNFVKYRENIVGGGALHADEISYLFDMEFIPETPTPDDQLVIDKMTAMWANFIKYGDPTPEITELLDVKWHPISGTKPQHCMAIATELSLISRPYNERMTFLDLFYEANEHLRRQ